ncbi:efflux RND transporter periplasmic adaptor subunit [Aquincola sp. MAHUQ-54]|uniref:Efflux RND transporter periplasmic adaptor subunit n=1 Tax=Aquincola agrisoli TaxID=3119538 RepID=A0AAW9QHW4_9BURK
MKCHCPPSGRLWPAAVLCAALALAACSGSKDKPAAAPAGPKEVGVVTLQVQRLAQTTELPGRTTARMVAEIRPQVGGIVQKRLFTEGALVKAGEVLYQIDPSTFQATFASAQATVRKAEATVAVAQSTAQRNAELVKIDAISQQVNEQSQASLQQAQADLGIARAALETARINLGFTRITAPIAGRVGLSTVTPGALVTANQATALTTVQQLDPIHVDVTQSSTELLRLKRDLAEGRLQRGGEGEARIRLVLEDGSRYTHEGRLAFSGVNVDPGTGSITLRALVPNPQGLLMPGMYVRAQLQEGVQDDALLVPQQAVTRNANGSASALVVEPDNKVARRTLTVDRAVGNRWQVTGGLQAGDRVIVEGSQRVKVGDTVRAVAMAEGGQAPRSPGGAASAAGSSSAAAAAAAATLPAAAAR